MDMAKRGKEGRGAAGGDRVLSPSGVTESRNGAQRHVELRLVLALAMAAGALLLALLAVAKERTDVLMLDLREWRPSSSVPDLAGSTLRDFFESIQTPIPEQRPFRLSLQVPPTARPHDFVAAEWDRPADPGRRYCLLVLTFGSPPAPGTLATTARLYARVQINGKGVADFRVPPDGAGGAIYEPRIEARDGRITVRVEARAEALPPGTPQQPPAAVHFEFASLRACGRP
jgi:hypothetical protein